MSFDSETTNAEFAGIPQPDLRALFTAMGRYGRSLDGGYVVRNYGGDLYMIKATNHTSGRCLFFTIDTEEPTKLVALLAYKKESDEAPESLIRTARERRGRYLEG